MDNTNSKIAAGIAVALAIGAVIVAMLNPVEQMHRLEADKLFREVIDLCDHSLKNPIYAANPIIYFERGYAERILGDYKDAIADQKMALTLRKKNWLLWGFKGLGVKHYLDHDFYLELGRNYLNLKDVKTAQESFESALKTEKSMEAYQALASVYEKNGDFKKAQEAYDNSYKQADSSEREIALHSRGLFYWRSDKPDEALKDLQAALKEKNCAEARVDSACIYHEKHEYKKAIEEFTKALSISKTERAYHGRALAEMESGNLLNEAASDLDRAIQLDPSCAEAKKDQQLVLERLQAIKKNKSN